MEEENEYVAGIAPRMMFLVPFPYGSVQFKALELTWATVQIEALRWIEALSCI